MSVVERILMQDSDLAGLILELRDTLIDSGCALSDLGACGADDLPCAVCPECLDQIGSDPHAVMDSHAADMAAVLIDRADEIAIVIPDPDHHDRPIDMIRRGMTPAEWIRDPRNAGSGGGGGAGSWIHDPDRGRIHDSGTPRP